jgi:hypothetical protein
LRCPRAIVSRATIIGPLINAGYLVKGELAQAYSIYPAFILVQARGTPVYLKQGLRDFETYPREYYAIFLEAENVVAYRCLGHRGRQPEANLQLPQDIS